MTAVHEDYRILEQEYAAIPESEFIKPFGSQGQVIPYAKNLLLIVERHGKELADEGLDPQLISKFPRLINGYDAAASVSAVSDAKGDIAQALAECRREAELIRDDLTEYSEKAFKDNADLLAQLKDIRLRRGAQNLSRELLELNTLCGMHKNLYGRFKKFNPDWIEAAAEYHLRLDSLIALKNNPDKSADIIRLRERQSITLLFRAFESIREYGELAFRNDPDLLKQLKYSWIRK